MNNQVKFKIDLTSRIKKMSSEKANYLADIVFSPYMSSSIISI